MVINRVGALVRGGDFYGRNALVDLRERLTRDACYQFYRQNVHNKSGVEDFNRLMTDLENDFYIRCDTASLRYEFASKLLRDWWLRHYGLEAIDEVTAHGTVL